MSIDSTILKMDCVLVETIGDFFGEEVLPCFPPMYTILIFYLTHSHKEAYWRPIMNLRLFSD
jgi:hypothetical protein